MPRAAGPGRARDDRPYREAYWRAFDRFFGPQNGPVIKSMLLAKFPPGDAGMSEVERVSYGLRQTMGWVADAIERTAMGEAPAAMADEEEDHAPRAGH